MISRGYPRTAIPVGNVLAEDQIQTNQIVPLSVSTTHALTNKHFLYRRYGVRPFPPKARALLTHTLILIWIEIESSKINVLNNHSLCAPLKRSESHRKRRVWSGMEWNDVERRGHITGSVFITVSISLPPGLMLCCVPVLSSVVVGLCVCVWLRCLYLVNYTIVDNYSIDWDVRFDKITNHTSHNRATETVRLEHTSYTLYLSTPVYG